MYHCSLCGAERWKEERASVDGVVFLKIIYECNSYREMRRFGGAWTVVADVYKCGQIIPNHKVSA